MANMPPRISLLLLSLLSSCHCVVTGFSVLSPSPAETLKKLLPRRNDSEEDNQEISLALSALVESARQANSQEDKNVELVPVGQWNAVYSRKKGADQGKFLPKDAISDCFRQDGTLSRRFQLPGRLISLEFNGYYTMSNNSLMTLTFEELKVRALGLPLPTINIRDGQGARAWIEKNVRGGTKKSEDGKQMKRPNIFSWLYVDDDICVARGSSGSVAIWCASSTPEEDD